MNGRDMLSDSQKACRFLRLVASCLAYAGALGLIDLMTVLLFFRTIDKIIFYLSLVMTFEGGFVLTMGGLTVLGTTPSVSKAREIIFKSEPWTKERQREGEKKGNVWITTGTILILAAFLLSAL